jgi:membrane-associated protein
MEGIDWLDLFRATDKFLLAIVHQNVMMVYVVLAAIIFSETGLVVMAFLPGDSLLFVAGAVAALNTGLSPWMLMAVIAAAAIVGNTVNYFIGFWLGQKIYDGSIKWIDKEALNKTRAFYEKWGGLTLVVARFTPIVRTFAPLVAGAGAMQIHRFQFYNIVGAALWTVSLVGGGYLFGNVPFVKNNLGVILLIGIGGIMVPAVAGAAWKLWRKRRGAPSGAA